MNFINQFGTVVCVFVFLFIQGLLLVYIINTLYHNRKFTYQTFIIIGASFAGTFAVYHYLNVNDEMYLIPLIGIYGLEFIFLIFMYFANRRT